MGVAAGSLALGLLLVAAGGGVADQPGFQLTQCAPPAKDDVKLTEDGRSIRNVYRLLGGTWVNVTGFRNPHHIFEYGTSRDDRYLLVWHMDFGPRRISVYDLRRGGGRVGRFEPEMGGSFCWNGQNRIVHVSGCGTGCRLCKVYSVEGKVLFRLVDSPMDVSPSGRYLVTFPIAWVGDRQIAIYDLHETSDASGQITTTPIWTMSSVGQVEHIDWRREEDVVIRYVHVTDVTATNPRDVTVDLRVRNGRR
jgi:hypothetical protein